MAMPVQQFQGQGAGLGFFRGAKAGANLVDQLFNTPYQRALAQNQLEMDRAKLEQQQLQTQYMEPTLQEKLAQMQIETQYAPQTKEAKLRQLAAQTGLTEAQIPLTQARVPLTEAQTKTAEENLRLLPLTSALKAQSALNDQANQSRLNSRFGPAYSLSRALGSMAKPAREAWIANNQGAYNEMLQQIGNAVFENNQPQAAINLLTEDFLTQLGLPTGERLEHPKTVANTNSYDKLGRFAETKDQDQIVELANKISANRDLTTNTTKVRAEAAEALDGLLDSPNVRETFQILANYQGVQGQAKAAMERFTDPAAYAQYESAYNQMPTVISGSLKALEAFGATDKGLETGLEYFRRAGKFYATDPNAAIDYFNKGIEILNAESEALRQTAEPLFDVRRRGQKDIEPIKKPSEFQVPTFETKEDWQNWYSGLDKEQRMIYQQKLKSKK